MKPFAGKFDTYDKSQQRLPFENPHCPPLIRLLQWKVLDICVESVRLEQGTSAVSVRIHDIGHFRRFSSLFGGEEAIETLVHNIMDTKLPADPYAEKIERANLDDKTRQQAMAYAALKVKTQFERRRKSFVATFFNKVMFNESGLRIADRLLFEYDIDLYVVVHWDRMPEKWPVADTFLERFYEPAELESDPLAQQRLDCVAGCARGNIILCELQSNARCQKEVEVIEKFLGDTTYQLKTDVVRAVLDEGPSFRIQKGENGEEKAVPVEKWNRHKTMLIFLAIPAISVSDRPESEHDDWYFHLLQAMSGDPSNRAGLYFLNKNYEEELKERENERQIRAELSLPDLREASVGDEIITEIRPQPADSGYQPDADPKELVLRSYQEELVQAAIAGKNCVVVAPTGSGKTVVACYAGLNHIEKRHAAKKAARVVFLVPKIPLVGQQQALFQTYCRGKYHVDGFHGSEKSSDGMGRRDEVLLAHVVVMTPQILINMLQSVRQSERLYVSDFSMIIFDEVHRATGNHPYVEICRLVQDWPHTKPQIVGLTASLNVSATAQTDESRMLENIYAMLALLDAPNLSTITSPANVDELNTLVGKPDNVVEVCRASSDSVFRGFIKRTLNEYHLKLCAELDRLTKARPNGFPTNTYQRFKKQKCVDYDKYEPLLQNVIQDLNKLNTTAKMTAAQYTRYIRVYVEATAIIEVMPPSVAFRFMDEAMAKLDAASLEQFDQFRKHRDTLKADVGNCDDPEIVQRLKEILVLQFETNPDSRAIIFVTQRSTAQRVAEFLNESRVLDAFLRDGDDRNAVGYVLGTNKQGLVQQSPQEQKTTLDKFNNGRLKVIVATSVVEEGLDVSACNLIIKYNCPSNSVVQLVQQAGRARAKNSKSVLLAVKNSVNEKENNAIVSEKYMRLCVNTIIKNTQKQLEVEVGRLKRNLENERRRELEEQRQMRARHELKLYDVSCSGCNQHFCKSNAIKKNYSNYMAMDPEVWERLDLQTRRKKSKYLDADTQPLSTLLCGKCKVEVGKAYKMRGVYLPQLDIKALAFKTASLHDLVTKDKWSSVENELFFVEQARQADFETMLNALSTSINVDKKRVLDFDSRQHMRHLDHARDELARRAQEESRRRANAPTIVNRRTDFSDDEEASNDVTA